MADALRFLAGKIRVSVKEEKLICFLGVLFLTAGFFILPNCALADSDENNLIITEIMYDPEGSDTGHSDWIEAYNSGDKSISFSKSDFGIIDEKELEIGSDGIHYKNCHKIDDDFEIKPGEFVLISSNKDNFKQDYPDVDEKKLNSAFSLSSNGDYIRLSDDKCKTFFVDFDFENSWGGKDNGKTLEKTDYSQNYSKNNWQESYILGGTPGEKNSEKPKPKEYTDKIRINELLSNPSGEESENEYIELYNYSGKDIDLWNWEIKDGSKTGKYLFPEKTIIKQNGYLEIYRKDFKFALNNSDETVYLFDPNGKKIDEAGYSGSAKEDVSYNFDGTFWRWSKKLTPGKENRFNNLPSSKLKAEKKIYKNMTAEFRVSSRDADGDKLKYTWDFGDGHKSYLQNTSHKYEKKGIYQVSLKIFDGSEEVFDNFEVEVGSFPKAELKIVGIKANPKGKDTDFETIKIKNSSKKKINLKGWSVATGWKELYNHPISKKFILKPGETKELTRKYSAFALNNKQTKIEFRRPDGSVAARVKYSKKEGIQEDEIYEKTENGWEWTGAQTNTDLALTSADDIKDNTEIKDIIGEETQDNKIEAENIQTNPENIDNNEEQIQEDEPQNSENGEVLGTETSINAENINKDNKISGNFFQKIFWSANQKANSFINFIFELL